MRIEDRPVALADDRERLKHVIEDHPAGCGTASSRRIA
jgi:hypothetical protein